MTNTNISVDQLAKDYGQLIWRLAHDLDIDLPTDISITAAADIITTQARYGKRHQGWRNYETWQFNLHLDATEELYKLWQGQAIKHLAYAKDDRSEARIKLADQLKEWMNDIVQLNANIGLKHELLMTDLLQGAIDSIDYDEVAESMIERLTPAPAPESDVQP